MPGSHVHGTSLAPGGMRMNMRRERHATPRADRLTIARALREMAALLEVAGQEPFRARAYARGAEVLERLESDLGALVDERRLTALSGIGPGLAAMITELHQTGHSKLLEEQRQRVPAVALELHRIPRLGLRKIVALHAALGIRTIEDLEAACEVGYSRRRKPRLPGRRPRAAGRDHRQHPPSPSHEYR